MTSALTVTEVRERPTLAVPEAAAFLGCSDDLVYEGVKTGTIPALRIGRKILIPTGPLLALVGREAV